MAKVGRFVTDPKAGAYCRIALESGEKIVVNHDKGSLTAGTLSVEVSKFLGLGSERVFSCDLASAAGRSVLARLTSATGEATPLAALVHYVEQCRSVAEVKDRCASLLERAP